MPFIPFIGLNHHRRTIIFGCGAVCNETTASYIWLLKAFKMVMCQKEPLSVITDGDSAMRGAIITEFPDVKHQLCSWHIGKNLYDNIRNRSIRAVFQDLISRKYTAEVFENKWKELLANKIGNKEKKWLLRMYEKKYLWAATYLHGHTFLGLRSTQRSESINSILHKYLNYGMTLVDMIHHYDRCVSGARRNEATDDSKASQFTPYLRTCTRKLELYVADVYTPAIFDLIQIDKQKGKNYCIVGHNIVDGLHNFVIAIDSNPEVCTIVCCKWENGKLVKLACECLQLETKGTPCSHMFSLMKYLNITSFPECCIWPRWTKNVKAGFASDRHGTVNEVSDHAIRNQKLLKLAKQVCYKAAKSEDQFSELMNFLDSKLASFKLKENKSEAYNDYNSDDGTCEINVDEDGDTTIVLDPIRAKTKGAPRKRLKAYSEKRTNRCGMCNQ
ncbi:protein FAR1-RELATED SEQUENCE 5-like [Asparagus officinalis]|uniref:protein FAR1-RELATED SEQUENCE 5-like n=1 Tax=Asparagus officinalis TaxID=4686 RepID=UPI00098DE189|nr:protein FAR1-RELATED SEQUENCE 5-like [Asparagus officinalis]